MRYINKGTCLSNNKYSQATGVVCGNVYKINFLRCFATIKREYLIIRNNEYFAMIINNSVKSGLVTVLRICGCRYILSWDTLVRFGLKYREIY